MAISLGPHCAYFRMRKLKPQVAKVSTVASVMCDKKAFIFKSHSLSIKYNLLECSTKIR